MNKDELERNLGVQPIMAIMQERGLKPHDLVSASRVPMTHKLVSRACKGRRLTNHSRKVVLEALQLACDHIYTMKDAFNY
jgi:hypothetical protein